MLWRKSLCSYIRMSVPLAQQAGHPKKSCMLHLRSSSGVNTGLHWLLQDAHRRFRGNPTNEEMSAALLCECPPLMLSAGSVCAAERCSHAWVKLSFAANLDSAQLRRGIDKVLVMIGWDEDPVSCLLLWFLNRITLGIRTVRDKGRSAPY